jgi:hypothetical protein
MTSIQVVRWARLPLLAIGFAVATGLSAAAQPPARPATAQGYAEASAAEPQDADALKDIDASKLDWSLLGANVSPSDAINPKKAATSKSPAGNDVAWTSSDKPNGVSAVSVKQSISPFWDTRIGADMTVARQGTLTNSEALSERLANGGTLPQSSGIAWAAITAPGVASIWDKTSVEARVDAGTDQSKLGTSFSKSLPLSEQYSLTLQNGYNVVEQGVLPIPGIVSHPFRSYETDQSAKLSLNDSGLSLIAGQTLSTTDDKWLRKVGAEQKLFDGVTVSGSIGETAQGTANRSITAGFKRSW